MKPTSCRRLCAFLACPNDSSSNPEKSFFTFPLDGERCKSWVQNSGRTDLADKHPSQLYQHLFLCSDHFDESAFISRFCVRRPRLVPQAVPTLSGTNFLERPSRGMKRKASGTRLTRTKKQKLVSSASNCKDLGRYVFAENLCKVEIREEEVDTTSTDPRNPGMATNPEQRVWTNKTVTKRNLPQVVKHSQEVSRLQALEKENEKLKMEQKEQSVSHKQTLAKMEGKLQYESQVRQKYKTSLEKLGLPTDDLDNRESFFDRVISNPDFMKAFSQRLIGANLCQSNEKPSNKNLKVCLKMFQSQVSTLETERCALRGTCAQLSAEKEEAMKNLDYFKENYDRLLRDQINLEKMQEQLVSKNEELLSRWRVTQRAFTSLQVETRTLKEEIAALKEKIDSQEASDSESES